MEALTFVEVLDRRGRVTQRVCLGSLPLTIGRALTNDIILDDRYVCPRHARILPNHDGTFVLEDLDSVNGIYHVSPAARVNRIPLHAGLQLRFGHTLVRFRSSDTPATPTLVDHRGLFATDGLFGRSTSAQMITALCIAYFALHSYLKQYTHDASQTVILEVLLIRSVTFVWAMGWALVNRIVAQQWRVAAHDAVACVFAVATMLADSLLAATGFLFPLGRVIPILDGVVTAGLVAWLLHAHLALLTTVPARKRLWNACLLALILVGTTQTMRYYGNTRFSNAADIDVAIEPLPAAWIPARSLDDFAGRLEAMHTRLDRRAQEKNDVESDLGQDGSPSHVARRYLGRRVLHPVRPARRGGTPVPHRP